MIEVEQAGGLVLLQDRGRPGHADLGVAHSGAFDVAAHDAANAAVGNPVTAATLEVALGPLVLRARRACFVAVTGAPGPLDVDGLALTPGHPFALLPGARLTVGAPSTGLRRWVAVRGGLDAAAVLGSRSRDTLAGLGPDPVRAGDVLGVGDAAGLSLHPGRGRAGADIAEPQHHDAAVGAVVLRAVAGPHPELFDPGAPAALAAHRYRVRPESDRVALRLDGPAVERVAGEVPPEGLVPGAVQVPPDGRPVVFGPDHPLTGGYPVVAVVTDLAALAQLRPGDDVVLRVAPPG